MLVVTQYQQVDTSTKPEQDSTNTIAKFSIDTANEFYPVSAGKNNST
jgi:hypothetical protein